MRLSAKKRFIPEATRQEQEDKSQTQPPEGRGSGYEETKLRLRRGVWGTVTGGKRKVRSSQLCAGTAKPQASSQEEDAAPARSEGGAFSPLTSKGRPCDPGACPLGGSVVSSSVNRRKLPIDTADVKFLKNNSGEHLTA